MQHFGELSLLKTLSLSVLFLLFHKGAPKILLFFNFLRLAVVWRGSRKKLIDVKTDELSLPMETVGVAVQTSLIPDLVACLSLMQATFPDFTSASPSGTSQFWQAVQITASVCSLVLAIIGEKPRFSMTLAGVVGLSFMVSPAPVYTSTLTLISIPIQSSLINLLTGDDYKLVQLKFGEISLLTQMLTFCIGDLMSFTLSKMVSFDWLIGCLPAYLDRSDSGTVAQVGLVGVLTTGLLVHNLPFMQRNNCTVSGRPKRVQNLPAQYKVRSFILWFFGPILLFWLPLMKALINKNPFVWIYTFVVGSQLHYGMIVYWVISLVMGLPLISWLSPKLKQIIARKLFHVLACAMFIPATFLTPTLMSLSYAIAVCLFFIIELLRYADIQPLATFLQGYYERYLDKRDHGPLVLTHMYLLLGCALPCWISFWLPENCPPGLKSGVAVLGIVVLGVGDTLAAAVGSTWGQRKWPGKQRTFEGSFAMLFGMVSTFILLSQFNDFLIGHQQFGGERSSNFTFGFSVLTFTGCIFVVFMEAITSQIDNLLLPLYASNVFVSFYLIGETFKI